MTVNNPGAAFKVQVAGVFYTIPAGVSDQPADVAAVMNRKIGNIVERARVKPVPKRSNPKLPR